MQRDRGGRENSNSSSSPFDSFEGFGLHGSMFGGKDPFDDPFFTRPFGSEFRSNFFSSSKPRNLQNASRSRELVIEEVDSDDEETMEDKEDCDVTWSNRNPLVEHPDDQDKDDGMNSNSNRKVISGSTNLNKVEKTEPRVQSVNFQKVTYGGINGAYYTATTSRRTGSDGATLEESRQADRTTGQATHRISRGINDKGHSVTRKLDSDGKVGTMQTLHNLNEDELMGFEQAWRGKHLQGWNDDLFDFPRNSGNGAGTLAAWEGFSDPFKNASERNGPSFQRTINQDQHSRARPKKVVRINIE